MAKHYVDMDIFNKAEKIAKQRIYAYRIILSDVLWSINNQATTKIYSGNDSAEQNYGYVIIPGTISFSIDPEPDLASIIEVLQVSGLIRKTRLGTREKADSELIASCNSKREFDSYCIVKTHFYAQKLIEIFTKSVDFSTKSYSEQENLTECFANRFRMYGVKDIEKIIIQNGLYKPTDKEILTIYLGLLGNCINNSIVDAADILFIRKKIEEGVSVADIQRSFDQRISPKERSVIAKHGITPDEVKALMKEYDRYTPDVAKALSIKTNSRITYQQVDRYCNLHGIPLGRYHNGAVFSDVMIINQVKGWPNQKYKCKCINCGSEIVLYQSTLYYYHKNQMKLCKNCKHKK